MTYIPEGGAGDSACPWGGTQGKPESPLVGLGLLLLLLASELYFITAALYARSPPRGLLVVGACLYFTFTFLTPLRYSERSAGDERSMLKNHGASRMKRLNAYSRFSTVIAQRTQPTWWSVDFLLEPLPCL